jgi:hypothetical protein
MLMEFLCYNSKRNAEIEKLSGGRASRLLNMAQPTDAQRATEALGSALFDSMTS